MVVKPEPHWLASVWGWTGMTWATFFIGPPSILPACTSQVTGDTPAGEMFSMHTATSAREWPLHSTPLPEAIALPAVQPGLPGEHGALVELGGGGRWRWRSR